MRISTEELNEKENSLKELEDMISNNVNSEEHPISKKVNNG
jgi:hypothetical protein